MTKKKIVVRVIVAALFALIAIFAVMFYKNNSYEIPQNYLKKFEDYKSYMDGSDINYYIYEDKIIKEIKNYYPLGSKYSSDYEVIQYDNNEDVETINSLIKVRNMLDGKNGKTVAKRYNY